MASAQIMCQVTEDDIAEHVRSRLAAEHEEKLRKRREKQARARGDAPHRAVRRVCSRACVRSTREDTTH